MNTFKAQDGSEIKLELVESPIDPSRKIPRKLGDGNFGCVFAASSAHGELFALKVVYQHQAESIEQKARIIDELRVSQIIGNTLRDNKDKHPEFDDLRNSYRNHLVLPLGYSESIDKDEEFSKYAKTFKSLDMEFSGYAYSMNRYDRSLKEVMDYGLQASDSDGSLLSGYAKLNAIPLSERQKSALPVIEQIAGGLRVLHAVQLRHQDIKPANIYFLNNQGKMEFRLGDLGFLNPTDPVVAGSAMVSQSSLAIGTKHYRSIEQIDYSDTSEVSVRVDGDKRTAELISRDPKFLRTNIGPGDLVVFPKSKSRRLYPIEKFKKDEKSTKVIVEVAIPPIDSADATQTFGTALLHDDDLTQASFIKKPTAKTDLFGLGAILFDIISAGESPERFYELLRKFDSLEGRISQDILAYYPTWSSGQYVDPEVSAIFQRVCGGRPSFVVHENVLRFLLRCMMSEPSDSYYRQLDFEGSLIGGKVPTSPWSKVQNDIRKLRDVTDSDIHYDYCEKNALTKTTQNGEFRGEPTSNQLTTDAVYFLDSLKESVRDSEDAPMSNGVRWKRGGAFLNKLFEEMYLAQRHDGCEKSLGRLRSFAPENIQIDYAENQIRSQENVAGVQGGGDLVKKLCSIDPFLTSIAKHESCFLPIWWSKRARRVRVKLATSLPSESIDDVPPAEQDIALDIRYIDFREFWWGIAPGDYLLVLNDSFRHSAYEVITGVQKGVAQMPIFARKCQGAPDVNSDITFRPDQMQDGYLVKKIDPVAYYGGMISIYIWHSLVDSPGSGLDGYGDCVSGAMGKYPANFLESPLNFDGEVSFLDRFRSRSKSEFSELASFRDETIRFCAWLMLGGFLKQDSEPWTEISDKFGIWCEKAGSLLGCQGTLRMQSLRHNERISDSLAAGHSYDELTVTRKIWDKVLDQYINSK